MVEVCPAQGRGWPQAGACGEYIVTGDVESMVQEQASQ